MGEVYNDLPCTIEDVVGLDVYKRQLLSSEPEP